MKFFGILVAGASLLGAANAQQACLETAVQIPSCGLNILTSLGSSFGCAFTDLACQCTYSSKIQKMAFTPVLEACKPTVALEVQSSADALCECVKYNGTVPASLAATATTSGINNYANELCVSYGLAIPTCGTAVLQSLASSVGSCGETDFQCQCAHEPEYRQAASTPVINACGTTTALLVQSAAADLCSCITANNAPLQTKAATAAPTGTMSSSRAAAPAVADNFAPIGGLAGILSIFAGFVAIL